MSWIAAILAVAAVATPPSVAPVDLDGVAIDPFAERAELSVFVFVRTDCPIANRYAPELRRLHEAFASRNVAFWLVYPDPQETPAAIRAHLAEYAHPGRVLRDPGHRLVEGTGVTVTPEVAVFRGRDRMIYRGRIDDRYGDLGRARPAAATHDLEQALAAALAGKPAPQRTTRAVGCFISDLK